MENGKEAEWVKIEEIYEDPANVRRHSAQNMEAIRSSLRRFGFQRPIVVAKDGRILAGNGTYRAAKEIGMEHVLVRRTNLEGLEATAYAIADNRTGELSEWDFDALSKVASDLVGAGFRAEDIGFTGGELQEIAEGLGSSLADLPTTDPDVETASPEDETTSPAAEPRQQVEDGRDDEDDFEPVDPSASAISKRGDLWILGDHRLLCGDSSIPEDLDHLLGGESIQLVNTDPPYNVKVEPRSNNAIAAGLSSFGGTKHHQSFDLSRRPGARKATHDQLRARDRPLANDFVTDEEFDRLLRAWFANAARVLDPGRSFYIWGGYSNASNYPAAIAESGLYSAQIIVWDKEHPVLTRKDFMGAHEFAFYGWKLGAAHKFFGPNNVTDLWRVKKISPQKMIHLTEKPVELARRAITYSSKEGENVLDLFGGSGSTLIGAEECRRRAFLIEIDPLYADGIVRRWEAFTGRTAILDGDGRSFSEVSAERLTDAQNSPQ